MSFETLRAQVYTTIDGTDSIIPDDASENHVIDASLNTEGNVYAASTWSDEQVMVTWGSQYDDPTDDWEDRAKVAFLHYDENEDTRFVQETFNLPYSLPQYEDKSTTQIARLDNTTGNFLIAGGGAHNGPAFIAPSSTIRDPWVDAYDVMQWSYDGTRPNEPIPGYTSINPDSDHSMSAVKCIRGAHTDGVIVVWAEDNQVIKQGYAPSEDAFFETPGCVTNITTLFSGLESASCCVYRNPNDSWLYLIWCTRRMTGTDYTTDDSWNYYNGSGHTNFGSEPDWPWTVIYKSTDDGGTWNYFNYVQAPFPAIFGFPGGKRTSITDVGSIFDTGAKDGSAFIGTPYFNGTGMYTPMVRWHATDAFGWYEDTDHIIWHSGDGLGVDDNWNYSESWTTYLGSTFDSPFDDTGWGLADKIDHLPLSGASRNIVEKDGIMYWAQNTNSNSGGFMKVWETANGGADWITYAADRWPALPYRRSPSWVLDNTWDPGDSTSHETTLAMYHGGNVYTPTLGTFVLGYYNNEITFQGTINSIRSNVLNPRVQEIGSRVALMGGSIPTVLGIRKEELHNGLYSYVLDRCSATSIY